VVRLGESARVAEVRDVGFPVGGFPVQEAIDAQGS
jgi:hypothetical protein